MKSSIKKSTYKAIYRLLDRVSPVDYDCGTLCGAACCTCGGDSVDEDGLDYELGMYLLPGEEKVFTMEEDWLKWSCEDALDYDFPDSWFGNVYFIRCKTPPVCQRNLRPLQCRFFPLEPYFDKNGELHVIISTAELPYSCPLITEKMKLNDDFIQATYTVWKHLVRDRLIFDLVQMDSKDKRRNHVPITIIK